MLRLLAISGLVTLAVLALAGRARAETEEPAFKVLEQQGAFELREYAPFLVAETLVKGADFEDAGNIAFGRLFRYISGNNNTPAERGGEKIAMTAPVIQQRSETSTEDGYRVAFIVPSGYNAQTVPQPTDANVRIRPMPARLVASLRYSGRWSESLFRTKERELRSLLATRGFDSDGEPIIARYNAPFVPYPFRHNEVLIPVVRR
jgi:SOUL heme-binding protein